MLDARRGVDVISLQKRWILVGLSAGLALPLVSVAQETAGWVVKPEWVRAHEEFLASDVLHGRGSATRDEEIAASYVASEFIGYGLKPAPGIGSYLQEADVETPQLDGHATLTIGTVSLTEGTDFHLITSTGQWVTAPIVKTTGVGAIPTGAAVLVTDPPGQTSMAEINKLRGSGAQMLIVVEDDSTRELSSRLGGKTRTPAGLKGDPQSAGRGTIVTISQATMDRLLKVEAGASAVLAVHPLQQTTPKQTFNAIGWMPGSDPADGTILLTAHLDHLGVGAAVSGDAIYNGANDDAAGTTAVLELAHALASGSKLRRNVLFVCYGSEEIGELGSTYFGEHPPVPLKGVRVLGVDRVALDDEAFRDHLEAALQDFAAHRRGGDTLDDGAWRWMRERLSYQRGDFDDPATFAALDARLGAGNGVFYLAVADRFFGPLVDQLARAGLTAEEGRFRRIVVEKPFGHDLGSARALNARLLSHVGEQQIFRIDHYLGKETVQNILALRFSNGMFEPLWRRDHIDHVQITAAETVGVERRGAFYETTGALRDMVPNHMFQLLSMVAMEAPTSFDAEAVRNEKVKVLQSLHPLREEQALSRVMRGQYRAGRIGGQDVLGYCDEPDVDRRSSTESYVALKLHIDNWRWAGVPFYIRTGKRLATRRTEIAIHFKQAPFALFRDTPVERLTPNVLTLHIQPSEGASIQFSAKMPGPVVRLGGVQMKFDYADWFKEGPSTGYETLLYDVLAGDATLFQRADNVEAGWEAMQPVLDAWDAGHIHVHPYAAGSAGPPEADALLAADGRRWQRLS